jgi:hypothetical protein
MAELDSHDLAHKDKSAHAFIVLHRAEDVPQQKAIDAINAYRNAPGFFDVNTKTADERGLKFEPAPVFGRLHLILVVQGGRENSENTAHAETHNHLDRIAARLMGLRTLNPGEPVFDFERHH